MEVDDIETVAVLGAGNMGHGIAEVAALAGYDVNMRDIKDEFVENGYDQIEWSLGKLAEKGQISEDERDEILAVYHELDVFDDVRDGIERLRDGGYDCYVVSNGNPEMLDSMVEHAAIGDLLEDTISADEVETFKPDAELYRHAAARTGTPIDEIAHVTAGWFDVMGAQHAGMQGVWVDRKETPYEPFDGDPELTIETFYELADELSV